MLLLRTSVSEEEPATGLVPKEGGYPIILGQGMEAEDLEVEYIAFKDGARSRLLALTNPYLAKNAVRAIRALNAGKEAELDEVAEAIAGQ